MTSWTGFTPVLCLLSSLSVRVFQYVVSGASGPLLRPLWVEKVIDRPVELDHGKDS